MRIAIIGGGAGGMMAAATIALASLPGTKIFLVEKNSLLGNKVLISGGGRCNVTTGLRDMKELIKKYPRGGQFLRTALYEFPPESVYEWFESQGVPLKVEKDLRVFPVSNQGKDIVGVFEKIFQKKGVQVLFKRQVLHIEKNEQFQISFKEHEPLEVDRVILATGGQAYRHTGSTGDGYAFAEGLGHHITSLAPSLSSFVTRETWPATLAGVSFQEATLIAKGTKTYEFHGPFLFTHKGMSGPGVFALSSLSAFEEYGKDKPLQIMIDLVPRISHEELLGSLQKYAQMHPKKTFLTMLHEYGPWSLCEVWANLVDFSSEKPLSEVPKKVLNKTVELLKRLPLSVVGRGAGDEFVTAGGIELSEISPKTLESKICPGLFFAGELVNVDGFTGGFNLQASWATGRLSGIHAAGIHEKIL